MAMIALAAALALAAAPAASAASVPVYVMLPLTAVSPDGSVNDPSQLATDFAAVKRAGVDGIMTDVWWGAVEHSPGTYNWDGYSKIFGMAQSAGLSVVAIMSFHACGGNVGDSCAIPLPPFVTNNDTIFYRDREGRIDREYISLGADTVAVAGRPPIQMYSDFMQSFATNVMPAADVRRVEISMGPAGELRYPSYTATSFPGVGEFQCYDPHLAESLREAASAAGHSDWGGGGPDNAGTYASKTAPFWQSGGDNSYDSDYGRFFLSWYSQQLVAHADRVLGAAASVFGAAGAPISGKVAGVHWGYKTDAHPAECTAGYYNTDGNNGYTDIARTFAAHGAGLSFTCLEMFDSDQCGTCGPQELVAQVHAAADDAGARFSGENALPVFDARHYGQIEYQARTPSPIAFFGYLRMSDALRSSPSNMATFTTFVSAMHNL